MLRCMLSSSFLLVAASIAMAQDHPQKQCSWKESEIDHPRLAVVRKPSTAWQCYRNGNCSSFERHPGDTIEVALTEDGWSCGYVSSAEGAGPEWVREDELQPVAADPNPPLTAWAGNWSGGEDRVQIQVAKAAARLIINGSAVWKGLNGIQHSGDIKGEAEPAGDTIHYAEGSCSVEMILIGDYILAHDNGACGGLNARFGGVWKREK